jgi:DNA-binding MarR family transcriptional regulator
MNEPHFANKIISALIRVKTDMQAIMEPIFRSLDLGSLQAFILIGISKGTIVNISGIGKELGMNQGNASSLCKKMEKDGYLFRTRDNFDKRIVRLSLSPEGQQKVSQIWSILDQSNSFLEDIDPVKKESVLRGLNDLVEIVENIPPIINTRQT